ncbi:MAG: S-layer homology domain-containing protein [Firmicutes bacterium]|nr:S-layer homology domain-containing protein [Bacillota bacterium]
MKVRVRVMSMLLAIMFVFFGIGVTSTAATYSDVKETSNYYQAVSLLSALGLLKGYEDGDFRPEGEITRAEFAAVVVRALGQEETSQSSQGATQFVDVANDFWGSGYINVATNFGIINGYGDGNFGPDDKVTYEQAVKMVVCALGYEPLALGKVGNDPDAVWPGGYLAAAAELNIVTGVAGVEGTPAKRWQVARLVYNSLDVKLMEKSVLQGQDRFIKSDTKTLLSDKLLVYYDLGEFRANTVETVSASGAKARAGEVIIFSSTLRNEEVYKDGGVNTANLIGRSIKYYYTESPDGVKTLLYIENRTDLSDVLVIDSSNIESHTGTFSKGLTINYWQDKDNDVRLSTVDVIENPTIMVNGGAPDAGINEDALYPLSGSIELVDSNGDGAYDGIFITSYETYVLKSVNSSTKEIVDTYRTSAQGNTLKLDEDSSNNLIDIKRADGTKLTFSGLSKWNVLSVKKGRSGSRDVYDIIVSNASVKGTVTGVEDEQSILINDKKYEVSQYYLKYANEKLEIDDSGNFYLDKDGKIAGVEKTAAASSNYGYLVGIDYKSGVYKFSMLTQGSTSVMTYNGISRVRIDGELYTSDNGVNYLRGIVNNESININVDLKGREETVGNYTPMLVRYTQNDKKEITSLQTVESSDLNLHNFGDKSTTQFKYSTDKYKFTVGTDEMFRISTNTMVFVVPYDRSNSDIYARKDYKFFKNSESYYVEAYDTSGDFHTAKAVVVYDSGVVEINSSSPVAIIQAKRAEANSDDPDYDGKIDAYVFGYQNTGSSKSITAKYSDLSGYNIGDVIRYEVNAKGYLELIEKVYDVTGDMENVSISTTTDSTTGYKLNLNSGLLYNVDDEGGETILLTKVTDPNNANKNDFDFKILSSTIALGYDATLSSSRRVYPLDGESKFVYSTLDSYTASEQTETVVAQEVLVIQVLRDGNITQSCVYVIKNR